MWTESRGMGRPNRSCAKGNGWTNPLRAVSALALDIAIGAAAPHAHLPRVTADFAVLDEAASHVLLEVNLHLLATIGARHEKVLVHRGSSVQQLVGEGSSAVL